MVFATVHDRPAAGCTPDINEANYAEYNSYFIAALSGTDRLGQTIDQPDYDGDGKISFEEAHAYVILTADTIDFPIKTSDIFLDEFSEFGEEESDLLADDLPYDQVLALANPVEKEVLEGLSKQLKLEGNNRLVDAYNVLHPEKKEGEKRREAATRARKVEDANPRRFAKKMARTFESTESHFDRTTHYPMRGVHGRRQNSR